MKRIDIANDPIPSGDPNVPGRTQITKADPPIGPLSGNWRETVTPVMTVYKLVSRNILLRTYDMILIAFKVFF